jgi:hypothetical protein
MLIKASRIPKTLPTTPVWGDAEYIIISELQKVFEGKLSAANAASEMTAQVNQLLKQQK